MIGVFIKRGNLATHTHTHREHHGKTKAEIQVMFLQIKEYQRLPANHQKLVKGLKEMIPDSSRKGPAAQTLRLCVS